ncbi:MAG: replication-relaxation family protein [Chloroflexota bacterium]|nr:replication-relaxation family protein [Chloroflexota bacterium]
MRRIIFDATSLTPRQARHRATRSLRRLFDAGFVRRVPVFAPSASSGQLSMQIVNVLSAKGARAIGLEPRWARSRAPKEREVLTHAFWLVELAVCAMEGCPEPLSITTWWDDRVLAGRKRRGQLSLPNIPDGLLVVENLSTGKLFPSLIEVDMGTESVSAHSHARRDFARKIEGYLDYLGSPFRQEFGIQASPIVLIVTESERRLQSLRTTTQRLGGGGRFWFSTLSRLRQSADDNRSQTSDSGALQGPFWASNWQTAVDDEWRSLAARCGV